MEPSPSRPRVAAEAADPLFFLPAHLLDEILRHLDLRDAVRTSALSRSWRRRWESVPGLALSFPDHTPPCVVVGVLLLYSAPRVSRFAYEVGDDSASHLDHCLITLSRRSVESISIALGISDWDGRPRLIHSSIFSCTRVVSLNLAWFDIPPLPTGFSGFPVLEELHLSYLSFPDDGERHLQAIIRGSPLLRVLSLVEVENPVECVIEAPNLHSLTLWPETDGTDHNCRFGGELPCLQHAEIVVPRYLHDGHDCVGFLTGVARARKLTLCFEFDEVTIDSIPFTFYNLRSLDLWIDFSVMNPILLMFSLLRSSPNLEKLKIEMRGQETIADWEFLNAQWTDGMCANLRVVEIICYHAWSLVSFMKLILSKASLLCTLSVHERVGSQEDLLNELLTCRRASAQAQVLFKV